MKATIRASEIKTRAIRMAEVTGEDAAVEDGRVVEDTGGGGAAWEAERAMRSVRKCASS